MNRIRELRQSKGLSQHVLALACGVTENTVGRWERGTMLIRKRHQKVLARTLGVTVNDLQLENPVH